LRGKKGFLIAVGHMLICFGFLVIVKECWVSLNVDATRTIIQKEKEKEANSVRIIVAIVDLEKDA